MRWFIYYFTWLFATLFDAFVVFLVFGHNVGLGVLPQNWGFFTVWLAMAVVLYVLSTPVAMTTVYQSLFPDKIESLKQLGWTLAKRK